MIEELKLRLDDFQDQIVEMRGYLDVETRKKTLVDLENKAAAPGFWNDQSKAKKVIGETTKIRSVLKPFVALEQAFNDSRVMLELAEIEDDDIQKAQALKESTSLLEQIEKIFKQLETQSLLSGKLDSNNAYLTLHAGAGGTESCDWAGMLFRMYRRYCEQQNFELEIMEYQSGDEAGVKRVTFLASGLSAFGYLKAERGVHRLVRISPFDANKRRHTSFAALDVVAEVSEDIQVEIKEADLRIDTYRASGAGGQHVNTTDSAVRITHIPTGVAVACQAERSQHMNRTKAMNILKAKVYELMLDRKRKDMEKFYGEKGDIAWGSQIRSYVMQPYTMVKDHRTEFETSNVNAVLDGNIQEFIEAYLKKSVTNNK
ncbi:peptide chain release factor 2 [Verrucomicrobiota bacterium]